MTKDKELSLYREFEQLEAEEHVTAMVLARNPTLNQLKLLYNMFVRKGDKEKAKQIKEIYERKRKV